MPVDLSKDHPLSAKYEAAKVSVRKSGLAYPVACYLVCDYSGSMRRYYRDGTMQDLSDRIVALSAVVDDDGEVPVILFDTDARRPVDVNVHQSAGAMDRVVEAAGGMGGTDYAPALEAVRKLHREKGNGNPGLVIFQTDGDTVNRNGVTRQIVDSAPEPLFFQFMGYGHEEKTYLEKLNSMGGRVIDNAGYFHAGPNPKALSDEELYDKLIGGEFTQEWIPAYIEQFGGFAAPRPVRLTLTPGWAA